MQKHAGKRSKAPGGGGGGIWGGVVALPCGQAKDGSACAGGSQSQNRLPGYQTLP